MGESVKQEVREDVQIQIPRGLFLGGSKIQLNCLWWNSEESSSEARSDWPTPLMLKAADIRKIGLEVINPVEIWDVCSRCVEIIIPSIPGGRVVKVKWVSRNGNMYCSQEVWGGQGEDEMSVDLDVRLNRKIEIEFLKAVEDQEGI